MSSENGYDTYPALKWLNDHFTAEHLPDKEWIVLGKEGILYHSPCLDEVLAQERDDDTVVLYINLTI